jgi:predicted tellurium resistance membrane protein TerC
LNVAVFAIAGIIGVMFLIRGTRLMSDPESEGTQTRRYVVYLWIVVYAFVGSQMAWTLRPFVGAPGLGFELFRQLGGNFYANIFASIGEILGFFMVR